jgi:hypothetical protein
MYGTVSKALFVAVRRFTGFGDRWMLFPSWHPAQVGPPGSRENFKRESDVTDFTILCIVWSNYTE